MFTWLDGWKTNKPGCSDWSGEYIQRQMGKAQVSWRNWLGQVMGEMGGVRDCTEPDQGSWLIHALNLWVLHNVLFCSVSFINTTKGSEVSREILLRSAIGMKDCFLILPSFVSDHWLSWRICCSRLQTGILMEGFSLRETDGERVRHVQEGYTTL